VQYQGFVKCRHGPDSCPARRAGCGDPCGSGLAGVPRRQRSEADRTVSRGRPLRSVRSWRVGVDAGLSGFARRVAGPAAVWPTLFGLNPLPGLGPGAQLAALLVKRTSRCVRQEPTLHLTVRLSPRAFSSLLCGPGLTRFEQHGLKFIDTRLLRPTLWLPLITRLSSLRGRSRKRTGRF